MSIQILPSQGSISGRIGKGFAEGLTEQIPKQIERNRLTQGLQEMKKNPSVDPLDQLTQLYQSGATPEQISQIQPLLERANANREAQREANNISQNKTPVKNTAQKGNENVVGENTTLGNKNKKTPKKPSLITKGPQQASLNPILPLTTEEIKTQGAENRKNFPNKYKTQAEGEAEAIAQRNREIASQQAEINLGVTQKGLRNELENELAKRLGFDLQKGGFEQFTDVPGNYIKKVLDEEDTEIASGNKSTQEAAEDASKNIKDYASLRLANSTEGKKWMVSKDPKAVRSMVNNQKEGYKERGELKTFVNDLITNHNVTRPRAEYIAHPIKDNKELNNWLSKVKPESFFDKLGNMFTDTRNEDQARKIGRELPKYIGDNDSLGAIAVELDGKGLDGTAFIDEVRDLYKNNKIRLSPDQADELNTTGSLQPSIGDWFLFSLGDFGHLPEVL